MSRMSRRAALLLLACSLPALAMEPLPATSMDDTRDYRVEVLQVSDIAPYQESLDGFLSVLSSNNVVEGRNLRLNRVTIDFDLENGGFWSRLGVLMRIREEALRIAASHPDLVLTIGTPATKFARSILEQAHVPVVFTAVADPLDAGCVSLYDGGPGVTGATLYTDMAQQVAMIRRVFPRVERIGMVHTDDENGVANVEAARREAARLGVGVFSQLLDKRDDILPVLKAMYRNGAGAQMFAVPLDTYYGLRKYGPANDLGEFSIENGVPVVSLAMVRVPGAAMYVGADFGAIGRLSGQQAVKIIKHHTRVEVLPILKLEQPTVLIDPARMDALHIDLPSSLLERKTAGKDGFWQIVMNP